MAMDASGSTQFNVFEFYRMYCEITSGSNACGMEGYNPDDESLQGRCSREALNNLLMLINSTVHTRMSIFDEILKLMSTLDLVDFSEFSRLYDFVFFMCRENGQKNITVSKAVTSWRLVLPGRFRLLNHWCNFVEKNQRHNISEDTWRQVLAFSRCVHENLEGYDPEGAWPVLIDDFVDHMYRIMGTNSSSLFCSCGDSETQQFEESRPGLRMLPGAKRKNCQDFQLHGTEPSDNFSSSYILLGPKRRQANTECKENPDEDEPNDVAEAVKHNGLVGCPKSPCAVEGSLSKGFASLFSGHSCLQFDTERRVSFT